MQRSVTFRSKVDGWLAAVMIGSSAILAVVAVTLAVSGRALPERLLSLVFIAVAGFQVWLLRSTRYTMDASHLHVRSGPFTWRVPLSEIRHITPTRNPLSSPALSLDRLRIDRGPKASLMISPEDKDAFLAELRRRRKPG